MPSDYDYVPPGCETVGIDYCHIHFGTRNEDEQGDCDWRYRGQDEDASCVLTPLFVVAPTPLIVVTP